MNDRQLRYAHAIWNERSFSRAAAKMGVSQPSLSEQIRLLEEELGFSLFYRNSRGVEPSANGLAFLESAANVVSGMSALKELARELKGKPGATVRIGINSGLARSILPRVAQTLAASNVKTRWELVTATTRRVLRLVHQQRLDLAIVFEGEVKPVSEKLLRANLAETEIALLTPPNHPLANHPLAKRRDALALAEFAKPDDARSPERGRNRARDRRRLRRPRIAQIHGDERRRRRDRSAHHCRRRGRARHPARPADRRPAAGCDPARLASRAAVTAHRARPRAAGQRAWLGQIALLEI
jgi:DNA-binding transcriptional LysR family regulator